MWPGFIEQFSVALRSVLTSVASDSIDVNIVGGAVGGQSVKQGDQHDDATSPWFTQIVDGAGASLSAAIAADVPTSALLMAAKNASGKLTAIIVGATTPAASLSVTGSLATSQTELAEVTASGSATPFGSLAAGPSGVRVQNTSASGGPNVRVGSGSVSATRGVQLAPGQWEIFAVTNASALNHFAESGSPTVAASQA